MIYCWCVIRPTPIWCVRLPKKSNLNAICFCFQGEHRKKCDRHENQTPISYAIRNCTTWIKRDLAKNSLEIKVGWPFWLKILNIFNSIIEISGNIWSSIQIFFWKIGFQLSFLNNVGTKPITTLFSNSQYYWVTSQITAKVGVIDGHFILPAGWPRGQIVERNVRSGEFLHFK